MKKLLAVSIVLCSILLMLPILSPVGAEAQAPIVIDFDDLTDGQPVGTHYPGLTFSPEWLGIDCNVYHQCSEYPPHSSPMMIYSPGYYAPRIDFDFPISQVGGWFATDGTTVYLEGYDYSDTLVASGSVSSGWNNNAYLSISDPQCSIKYVIIYDAVSYWAMDDFEYTPCPQRGVPTLSQWGMIGMAILLGAVLIWSVRRRWVVSAGKS